MTEQTDEKAPEKASRRIDLKPTQAAASGLAAVTVAILGSEFGWAGSVFGAGLASVVTTVAATLYQQTLDKTKETVKEKVVARTAPVDRQTAVAPPLAPRPPMPLQGNLAGPQRPGAPMRPMPGQPGQPGVPPLPGQAPGQRMPQAPGPDQPTQARPQPTQINLGDQQAKTFSAIDPAKPLSEQQTRIVRPVQPGPTQVLGQQHQAGPTQAMPQQAGPTQAMPTRALNGQPPPDQHGTQVIGPPVKEKRKLPWKLIAGMSAAAFLFGLLVLTGLEAIKGGSLLGGNQGTSVGRMVGYTPSNQPDPVDEQPADTTDGTPQQDSQTPQTEQSQTPQTEQSTPQTEESTPLPEDNETEQQPNQQQQRPNPQGGQAPQEQETPTP